MEIQLNRPVSQLPIQDSIKRNFTTTELNLDIVHHFQSVGMRIDINNNDSTNALQYSINNGSLITFNGRGSIVLENIQIENLRILPHGTTGSGDVSVNICSLSYLRHLGIIIDYSDITRLTQRVTLKSIIKNWLNS